MKCEDYQNKMEDFFLGELSGSDQDLLENHVTECNACADVWAEFQMIRKGIEQLEIEQKPSPWIKNKIFDFAEAQIAKKTRGTWFQWLMMLSRPAYAAAISLAVVLSISVWMKQNEISQAPLEQAPVLQPEAKKAPSAVMPLKAFVNPGTSVPSIETGIKMISSDNEPADEKMKPLEEPIAAKEIAVPGGLAKRTSSENTYDKILELINNNNCKSARKLLEENKNEISDEQLKIATLRLQACSQ